jgi:hypothetical protein
VGDLALAGVVDEVLLRREQRREELVRNLAVRYPSVVLLAPAYLVDEVLRFRQLGFTKG